jgi:hypothetical protein
MKYYVIQDKTIGLVQWYGESSSSDQAVDEFYAEMGSCHDYDPTGIDSPWVITELSENQSKIFEGLWECGGTYHQPAIDYVESIKGNMS